MSAANPFFHRREFDVAVTDDWKVVAYYQLPSGLATLDIRPRTGGAAKKVVIDAGPATPPVGTTAQIRVSALTDTRFYVAYQSAQSMIRGALYDAETSSLYSYTLGTYGGAGIKGLSLFPSDEGPVAMYLDVETLEPRIALVRWNGSIFRGFARALDEESGGLLTLVATIQFYMFNQSFVGTGLNGAMFIAGNSLHVAPFTIRIPASRRRAARHP